MSHWGGCVSRVCAKTSKQSCGKCAYIPRHDDVHQSQNHETDPPPLVRPVLGCCAIRDAALALALGSIASNLSLAEAVVPRSEFLGLPEATADGLATSFVAAVASLHDAREKLRRNREADGCYAGGCCYWASRSQQLMRLLLYGFAWAVGG